MKSCLSESLSLDSPAFAVDQRSREILGRIKSVFSAKGFDGASMQDLALAAGMSAGNFYRYFPSKKAIIEALVQLDLERAEREFEQIITSPNPRKAFRDIVKGRVETLHCDSGPIWAEIDAASFRRPEIAALLRQMETHVCGKIIGVFARIAGVPVSTAEQRFLAQARLIMLLIHGLSMMSRASDGELQRASNRDLAALVIDIIDQTVGNLPESAKARADGNAHA